MKIIKGYLNKKTIQRCVFIATQTFLYLYSSSALSAIEKNFFNEDEHKNWLLRGMLTDIRPLGVNSKIPIIGGNVETPEKVTPGIDASYFISKNFSFEVQLGVFSRDYIIRNSSLGDIRIGTIENNSISLIAQYHIYIGEKFIPYLGLGENHAWARKTEPAEGIPELNVKDINSVILNAGIDYALSKNWMVSTSIKYFISPEYKFVANGFEASIKMNTLVTGIGLGYRF